MEIIVTILLSPLFCKNMEYQVLKRKNGQEVVLCNLEELLIDYYEVTSATQLHQYVNSSGEYSIKCPFCRDEGYEKEKLYIREDMKLGYCFKCTRAFSNVTDNITYDIRTPEFTTSEQFSLVKLSDKNWTLDMYNNEFDDYDEIGYNYLINKRHKYMSELYKALRFKFNNHNVVMPFYFHGELIYYQIRFTGPSKIKYFFPPITHKPIYSIEHGDNKKLFVCEGIFDAISGMIMYPDRTPVAVLGSYVSDYQLEMIRTYCPEDIIVFMDETSISKKVADKLITKLDYSNISIRPSDGQDPEELFKELIKKGVY